jgi:hypothetical protein
MDSVKASSCWRILNAHLTWPVTLLFSWKLFGSDLWKLLIRRVDGSPGSDLCKLLIQNEKIA